MIEHENDFESLRRLLALKRHEVPPPGYFNQFSDLVVQRIRSGNQASRYSEESLEQVPWLAKLLQLLNGKPVFAGGFAGALCLALFLGMIYADRPDLAPEPLLPASANTTSFAALSPAAALSQSASPIGIVSSTNPVLSIQPIAGNFGQPNPLAQPVGFTIPGN